MSLKDLLLQRIAADGPISVADYMHEALLHPRFGYYSTRDPFGAGGDFITAPEITQMFGELIGLCLVQAWRDQGQPKDVLLVELGPGRGSLMRDALRAASKVPGFAPQVILIEASETLRKVQADTLKGHDITWQSSLAELPQDKPLFLIANEFLDALPIRQFQRDGEGWREIRIGAQDGELSFGLGQKQAQPILNDRLQDTKDGDLVEHCPALPALVTQIGTQIANHGGAALLIDYGDWRSLGGTLQALQNHTPVPPLANPGQADLTAHVDFEAIAKAAAPARFTRVTPQGVFLERLGITQRAQTLAKHMPPKALDAHIAAHRRLTHPEEMGNLFKVIGLYPDSAPPPAGLDP